VKTDLQDSHEPDYAPRIPVSDGTMPCPVPSPGGLPCSKRIPAGWTASEGHGGGHFWVSPETAQALDTGHYDALAALAGKPFTVHQPADCTPECPRYGEAAAYAEKTARETVNAR
jgi:hypothetical protein